MTCTKMVACWASLSVLLSASVFGAEPKSREGVVVQTFALHGETNGIDGTLQVVMDQRLTAPVREKLWGVGDWSFVFPENSMVYKEFSPLPPSHAELRITNGNGKVIAKRQLVTSLAKLEPWDLAAGKNLWFLLTEDHSRGLGSYNGLATFLLEVSNGTIRDVLAIDADSHREEGFRLMKSLRSDWRITRREDGGEILSLSSHPTDRGDFVMEYIRYSLEGAGWRAYKREGSGDWTSDQPFPPRSAFR
jgi:hypothetical protein